MSEKMVTATNAEGTVKISDDVIASIAAISAGEVEGVASLGGGLDIAELLGKKQPVAKGIKVSYVNDTISLDITVFLKYGVVVVDTAKKIQENVASAIESMTGKKVAGVNVLVGGIVIPKASE